MKTSGLLFTYYPDGSASLGFEDYGVKIFEGADYKVTYFLDKKTFDKLLKATKITKMPWYLYG